MNMANSQYTSPYSKKEALWNTGRVAQHYRRSRGWVCRMTRGGRLQVAVLGRGQSSAMYDPAELPSRDSFERGPLTRDVLMAGVTASYAEWTAIRDARIALAAQRLAEAMSGIKPQISAAGIADRDAAVRLAYDLPELLLLVRRAAEMPPPTARRAVRAHRMRLAGATWGEVGKMLGIRPASAMRLATRYARDLHEPAEHWVDAELARIRADLAPQPVTPTDPGPRKGYAPGWD